MTNNFPLELRIHMYNYIDDYQIRSKVHHHIFSVDVEVVHDRIFKNLNKVTNDFNIRNKHDNTFLMYMYM